MVARIYSVNMSWKDNYVSFDDTDIMTDYFHGYSLRINQTVEWIKKHGGQKIEITVTNDDPKIPALKRVMQIAQECGYSVKDESHLHTYEGYRNEEVKRFTYKWILTANPERIKVIEAEDLEEKRKREEAEAYAKTPEARKKRILSEIYQVKNVTAVFDHRGFHTVTEEERKEQLEALQKQLNEIS